MGSKKVTKVSEIKKKLKKRTWHYVQKPWEYEIECDKCGGHDIEWSEYDGRIWCYSCKKDVKGTKGVFDGPIPVGAAALLGMSFDRWDMKKKQILKWDNEKEKYLPIPDNRYRVLERIYKGCEDLEKENKRVRKKFKI